LKVERRRGTPRRRGEVDMRVVIPAVVAAFLSVALAVTLPPDATMFVTDDDGVIVGVGRSHAGERFVLDVMASYHGFARLVIVTSGGDVVVHDVLVMDGTVLLEFEDLRAIARRSGFLEVVVEAIDVVDAAGVPSAPAGVGGAERAPEDRPGVAPAPGGPVPAPPVDAPVGPPAAAPGAPVDPPGEPGPPASTPGLPDGPPAHGPGGVHGGGPPGGGAPGGGPPGGGAPGGGPPGGGPGGGPPDTDGEHGADDHPDDDRPGPPGQERRP